MFEAFRSEGEPRQKQLFGERVADLEWGMARTDVPCEHRELMYTVGLRVLFMGERKFHCRGAADVTTMRRERVRLQPGS